MLKLSLASALLFGANALTTDSKTDVKQNSEHSNWNWVSQDLTIEQITTQGP